MSVFVVQENPRRSIHDARRFGPLRVVYPAEAQVVLDSETPAALAQQRLAGFCDQDFLLLSGDPVLIGICCMVAARVNGGLVPLLKWDRIEQQYYPVVVDLRKEKADARVVG